MSYNKTNKKGAEKVHDVTADYVTALGPHNPYGAPRVIGVRELKEHTSEVLRQLEETGQSVIITRHGAPWGRLLPFTAQPSQRKDHGGSLRNIYPDLPDLPETAFQEIKGIWVGDIEGIEDDHID